MKTDKENIINIVKDAREECDYFREEYSMFAHIDAFGMNCRLSAIIRAMELLGWGEGTHIKIKIVKKILDRYIEENENET